MKPTFWLRFLFGLQLMMGLICIVCYLREVQIDRKIAPNIPRIVRDLRIVLPPSQNGHLLISAMTEQLDAGQSDRLALEWLALAAITALTTAPILGLLLVPQTAAERDERFVESCKTSR